MAEPKCPFSAVQAAGLVRCRNATQVVRRGGAEYDCTRAEALAVCTELAAHLKVHALPALGHEDDLTLTPHSVFERIQMGGLIGLRRMIEPDNDSPEIDDAWAVIEPAVAAAGVPRSIAPEHFVGAIEGYRLRSRRRRQ